MKRGNLSSSIALVALLFVAGCAPQLGLRMSVPNVPEPQRTFGEPARGEPVRVHVGKFMDTRQTDTVAVIEGREVASDGALSAVVQEGFERYFNEAGASVVLFNAPVIEGEIVESSVAVTPKFPASEARANARLDL